ncbi:MAG: hypothetical protein PVF87_04395 [Acidimicrobiia bacterium]|jgi:hypothetical protein
MIASFFEGAAQSPLPCSWAILVPALLLAFSTRGIRVLVVYSATLVFFAWLVVAGWVVPQLWAAGLVLLAAALAWWRGGPGIVVAAAIGAGVAWAWRPCVGPALGDALNTAQRHPVAALPALAVFLLGVLAVGFAAGRLLRFLPSRGSAATRFPAGVVGLVGASMIVGLYEPLASIFARWSTQLWA